MMLNWVIYDFMLQFQDLISDVILSQNSLCVCVRVCTRV